MLLLIVGLSAGACGSDAVEPCPIGDLTQPAELEVLSMDSFLNVMPVDMPMTAVPLLEPPQGGQIALIGARARNIDGCRLTLTTSLRDVCTNELLAVEQRSVVLEPTADGWGEPRPGTRADWANLPVCPNVAAPRELQGQSYLLRVALEDGDGRTVETSIPVVPTCPGPVGSEESDLCLCQCQAGYILGDDCPSGLMPGTPTECPAP